MARTDRRGRGAGQVRSAFTLLELLVALGIVALLAVLLLGAVVYARQTARDSTCKTNLTQFWRAYNLYANEHRDIVFHNTASPMRVSNVLYKDAAPTGWGHLYPRYVADHRLFYCPCDPVRDPEWQYGWMHWGSETGEVRGSYGYRGRQGLTSGPSVILTLSTVDRNPQKVLGCDFYGDVTTPPKTHHRSHINVLRCNGMVEQMSEKPTFGPTEVALAAALQVIDR